MSDSTATPQQREQALQADFRSNTERDAAIVELQRQLEIQQAQIARLADLVCHLRDEDNHRNGIMQGLPSSYEITWTIPEAGTQLGAE